MRTFTLVLMLAALSSACTNFNRPTVDASEVVERSTVPARHAEVGDIEYVNLCVAKECDATRLSYTRAFRDAAVLSNAIEELDRYAVEAAASGDISDLNRSSAEMPSLKLELERVRARLDALDPDRDFDSVSLQIITRRALIDARQETDAARHALKRAHGRIESALGEDPFMLVRWEGDTTAPIQTIAPTPTNVWVLDAELDGWKRAEASTVQPEGKPWGGRCTTTQKPSFELVRYQPANEPMILVLD